MIGPGYSLLRLNMPAVFSSSAFSPTLFGFKDKRLEANFQAAFAENAKTLDIFANVSFILLMVYVSWRLHLDGAALLEVLSVFCGVLLIHGTWFWILTWPKSSQKAKWRARIIVLQRLHNVYCGIVCDSVILYPYMEEVGWVYCIHNILTASRVLVFPMLILGMRLPFRYHFPTMLITGAAFSKLNHQLCSQCSPAMQDHFSVTADVLSRLSAASTLLSPQTQAPSIQKQHACLAVVELVMISCASLLPSLVLCFSETKFRHDFLLRYRGWEESPQARATSGSSRSESQAGRAATQAELDKVAGLSIFPVAVAIAALPVMSFIWNIHIVVDKLLSP